MKKFTISIISALMICMCLAACGSDTTIKEATEASQGTTAKAPATTAAAATTKSDDGDDSIDGGVVVDNEAGANDSQVE